MFIDYRASQFTRLAKCRNGKGCWRSRSAPAPCLHCRPSKRILAVSFLSLWKSHSMWAAAFWKLPYAGFAVVLGLRLRYAFALLSCLFMLLFHSDKIVGSRLLSCVQTLVGLWIRLRWDYMWPPPLFLHCKT
jgi:hypothetical protein